MVVIRLVLNCIMILIHSLIISVQQAVFSAVFCKFPDPVEISQFLIFVHRF